MIFMEEAEQELGRDEAALNLFLTLVEGCARGTSRCEVPLDHLLMAPPPSPILAAMEGASEPARRTELAEEKKKGKEIKYCGGGKTSKGIRDERERRDKITQLYSKLRVMVPNVVSHKETRERVINGTIGYIKELEQCIKDLEGQKEKKRKAAAALPILTHRSSVDVTLTGNTVFFGIQTATNIPGLASRILQVFDAQNTEVQVLAASASCVELTLTVTITAVLLSGDAAGDAERTIGRLKAHLWNCLP